MKWEYIYVVWTTGVVIEPASDPQEEKRFGNITRFPEWLNRHGEQGWELVNVIVAHVEGKERLVAYFKRPKSIQLKI